MPDRWRIVKGRRGWSESQSRLFLGYAAFRIAFRSDEGTVMGRNRLFG
jgi:hypothetical protein